MVSIGSEGGPVRSGGRATLLGLLVACLAGTASGQETTDPVGELGQALRSPGQPEVRAREVKRKLDGLKTLGDFRRALFLPDWRDLYRDGLWAHSDQMQRQWVAKRFGEVIRDVLNHGDDAQRVAVAGLLGEMGTRASSGELVATLLHELAPDLVRLVRSGSPVAQRAAARALGQIHPEPDIALPALSDLLKGPSEGGRQAAAEALRDLAQGTGLRAPAGRPSLELVSALTEGLATARALVPVAAHGLHDRAAVVRRPCAEALSLAISHLASFLDLATPVGQDALEPASRREIEAKLSEAHSLYDTLVRELPVLTRSLADDNPDVRALAGRTLEALAQAQFRWKSLGMAEGEGDPARPDLKAVLPALAQVLSDPDPEARRRVLDVFDLVGPEPATLPLLLRALSDRDRFVRWGAIRTLATLKQPVGRPVLEALLPLLDDADTDIRLSVTRTLELLTAGESRTALAGAAGSMAEPLLRCLRTRDARVRAGAIRVLANLGPAAHTAIPALEDVLRDPDNEVRRVAAQALGTLGPAARPTLDSLRRAIQDDDETVREAAREAMLHISRADEVRVPREDSTQSTLGTDELPTAAGGRGRKGPP
jgi:HEAT repeat protein